MTPGSPFAMIVGVPSGLGRPTFAANRRANLRSPPAMPSRGLDHPE
jgi:hypothetical protein